MHVVLFDDQYWFDVCLASLFLIVCNCLSSDWTSDRPASVGPGIALSLSVIVIWSDLFIAHPFLLVGTGWLAGWFWGGGIFQGTKGARFCPSTKTYYEVCASLFHSLSSYPTLLQLSGMLDRWGSICRPLCCQCWTHHIMSQVWGLGEPAAIQVSFVGAACASLIESLTQVLF